MRRTQRHPVARQSLALLLTGLTVSSSLAGCSQLPTPAAQSTRLSAAQGSDVVAPPSERVYEVTGIDVAPPRGISGVTVPDTITPSGYFVFGDGVITAARFAASFGTAGATQSTASFELTEPTVLRRVSSDDASLSAVGTITVGGVERPDTEVEFSMIMLDEQSAEVVVEVNTPASMIDSLGAGPALVVHITFAAE